MARERRGTEVLERVLDPEARRVGQPQRLAVVVAVFVGQQAVAELHAVALGGRLPNAGIGDLVEPEPVVGVVGELAQRADPDLEELLPGARPLVTDLGELVRGAGQSVVPQGIVPRLPLRDVAVSPAAQVAHDAAPVETRAPVVAAFGIGKAHYGRDMAVGDTQDRSLRHPGAGGFYRCIRLQLAHGHFVFL